MCEPVLPGQAAGSIAECEKSLQKSLRRNSPSRLKHLLLSCCPRSKMFHRQTEKWPCFDFAPKLIRHSWYAAGCNIGCAVL